MCISILVCEGKLVKDLVAKKQLHPHTSNSYLLGQSNIFSYTSLNSHHHHLDVMEQKTDSGDGGLYGGESTNKGLTLVDVFFVNNSKRTFRKTIVSTIASFAFVPPTFRLLLTCKELLAIEGKIFEGYRLPTVLSDTSDELGDERKMHCLLVRAPNSCWLEWETPLKVKDLELPKGARVTLVGVFGVERFSELLTNWTKVTATFDDMGLKENLLSGIYAYGFPAPSAVQQLGIVPILQGRDTFVQSRYFYETYPGKTSALCIAILQLIKTDVATGILCKLGISRSAEILQQRHLRKRT